MHSVQTPRRGEGPPLRSRGANGGHHRRFERHRACRGACLARRGGWQLLLAARREAPLAAAAGELGATAVRCDVTDDGDVAALVAASRAAGGCDLLVHAAGAPARKGVLDADLATYRTAFELNYLGLVRVATAFWPLLEASRGRLVPVVSVAGTVALAPSAPYAAPRAQRCRGRAPTAPLHASTAWR